MCNFCPNLITLVLLCWSYHEYALGTSKWFKSFPNFAEIKRMCSKYSCFLGKLGWERVFFVFASFSLNGDVWTAQPSQYLFSFLLSLTNLRRAGLSKDASFKFDHWVLTNTDYDCEVNNGENGCYKWRGWRPFQWREKSRPENWIHATKSFWVADSTLSTGVTICVLYFLADLPSGGCHSHSNTYTNTNTLTLTLTQVSRYACCTFWQTCHLESMLTAATATLTLNFLLFYFFFFLLFGELATTSPCWRMSQPL